MHLLWITGRTFGRDLCQTTQIQVANALVRRGWKVTFVAPETADTAAFVKSEGHGFISGIKISKIPGLKSLTFERALRKQLPRILQDTRPDVAVCDWRGARGAWQGLERYGIGWAMVDRGPPAYRSILGRLQWLHYDRAWNKVGKRAAVCFSVSKSHGEFIQKRFSLVTPITTLPAAADATTFAVAPSESSEGRPGIDRPLKIVYHGRLDRSRNVANLVLVVEQLRNSGVDAELLMFGTGTAEKRLNRLARKFSWLTVSPKQPYSKVPELLAKMDVGALPMGNHLVWRTASPLKLFEYAASSMPIIATNIAAHRFEDEPEWIGLVDPNQMVDGMVRKLQSWVVDERIEELGQNARRELCDKYTWDHAVESAAESLKNIAKSD